MKKAKKLVFDVPMLPGFEDLVKSTAPVTAEEDQDTSSLPGVDSMLDFEIVHVRSLADLEDAERALLDPRINMIGLDIETSGLDPHRDSIRLIQLAIPGKVFIVDCSKVRVAALQKIITHGRYFIGQNFKFDLAFLMANGITIPNGNRLWCTKLAKQILYAGLPDGYFKKSSLKNVVATFMGASIDKAQQTSDWMQGDLSDAQYKYAAIDAAVLLPVAARQAHELRDVGLMPTMLLENRCMPAVVWMEDTGVVLDQEKWLNLEFQAVLDKEQTLRRLNDMAGTNTAIGQTMVNWDSPHQVAKVLRSRGQDVTSTSEQVLVELASQGEELAQEVVKLRHLSKRIGTYGREYLQWISPETGRIHADFVQLGAAASGRMSCNRPNLQQIPRTTDYRSCVVAPDGHWLVKADQSQIELRVASVIAPDYTLQNVFQEGKIDVHSLTAQKVLGVEHVDKQARQSAKAVNFGFVFGMGAAKFQTYAFSTYGVAMELDDALRFRKAYFDLYPGLASWHRRQPQQPVEVRTRLGRRRLNVMYFSEKLNTPVQGTAADGIKNALASLWEDRDRCPQARPILCVHDEIVLQSRDGYQDEAATWLQTTMEKAMAEYLPEVPVLAETAISRNWSMS